MLTDKKRENPPYFFVDVFFGVLKSATALEMSLKQQPNIFYSDKYYDDIYEYR